MANKVNLNNARPGVYAKVISEISDSGLCPFCEVRLSKIHPNPLEQKKYWTITNNAYPYIPKKEHILLIHREHIEDISELKTEAWIELQEIIRELTKTRNISGGTFMLRFGETKFTGASVVHLHAHLFQSDPEDPSYDPKKGVITRVG